MHYEILRNDPMRLVAKVNLAAYVASPVFKARPKSIIAFNTNFFWLGKPIGTFLFGDVELGERSMSKGNRPTIRIGQVECEAGPLLLDDGKDAWKQSFRDGKYQSDILRKTRRMTAGFLANGKLILAYFERCSLKEAMGQMRGFGCMYAISFDGGSSASLRVGEMVRGNPYITCGVRLDR